MTRRIIRSNPHQRHGRWVTALLLAVFLLSAGILLGLAAFEVPPATAAPRAALAAFVFVAFVLASAFATARANLHDLLAGNTRFAAIVYAWGSVAMLGVYEGTGLHWEHGWQYGAAMGVAALGLLAFAGQLRGPDAKLKRLAFWLTLAHGVAALAGISFLLWSGKVWALRSDWAANVVFLAGGLGVIGICMATAWGQAIASHGRG